MEKLEVLKEPGGAEIKIHIILLEEKVNEIIDLLKLPEKTEKQPFFAKAKKF
jgi:hypothetical protein